MPQAPALWLTVVCALSLGCSGWPRPAPDGGQTDGGSSPCTLTDLKTDGSIGARFDLTTQTLAYGRANPGGSYKVYLSDADGSNERALTFAAWPADRHQFPVEWAGAGQYLLVEVEKTTHPGSSSDAIPGYGAYTDSWAVSRDGSQAWKLVDLPNDSDHAMTHVALTPDGSRLALTKRVKAPQLFDANLAAGAYVFDVSDLVLSPSPHLENTVSYQPGNVDQGGEVDGFAADNVTLAFYSTYVSRNLFTSRIYTWNTATDEIRELSQESFSQAPDFTPQGNRLVYMTGQEADTFSGEIQGADWWLVDLDGSNRRRLTFMNKSGDPQSNGHRLLAGSISFDTDHSFYGDVLTAVFGLTGKMVKVSCPAL